MPYDFFQNRDCEYFPCHPGANPDTFSCIFCYCPLYALGDNCGGNYTYTENGIKDCSKCLRPHRRECYAAITEKVGEVIKMTKKQTMITLKKLGIEYMNSIIAFDRLCFPTDFWNEKDWNELLNDDRAIYYALLDGATIVGDVFIYNWLDERDYVKIMNLAIHPDYRGQGLAHQLLNHVTGEMRIFGMHRFFGETRASNKSMQRVFEDCGYVLSHIEKDYFEHPVESAYKYTLQL